ncbi:aminoglycoside phosphotransferase family protein [Flavicella sp.]|uniref:phosphotransferase enzyme family protein n=1 Tax=Flavicella sp. TaxID=2957742 RepID=UPI002611ACDB|nr:aminoglycoside phosphotransferase family protein [Flavicella sp.]MDG1805672.1 aminoglycoside phosphotransferase family protein [Flavicella sp.]MDG2280231.1 aminoglycoside phosphotransferase family protein [Flavicella sp.]
MLTKKLKKVFEQFDQSSNFQSYKELASGHINDTYFIETDESPFYVLQRINHGVFHDVPGLIENKVAVSDHLRKKLISQGKNANNVLSFIKTKTGASYYKGDEGNYWNLMVFIENSVTHEIVTAEEIAFEGGKLFGEFLEMTNDFDASTLCEVIPKFHDMSFRYSQFYDSLKQASDERLLKASVYIDLVNQMKEEMHILQNLKESGAIKIRVTHNDTKISNALFDKNNKGLCVIDTDTVMPGIVHYDFGDAIRTICNTAAEDEKNLDLVKFNSAFYKAYKKGFLEKIGTAISEIESKYLITGAKSMIFIMAIRFLTDFLNGDIYYKTSYGEHNLDRSKNQFKLLESLNNQISEL